MERSVAASPKRQYVQCKIVHNHLYIPDDLRKLFTVDAWMLRACHETAQAVALVTDFGMLEIAKKDLGGEFTFDAAQKAAADYGAGFRCATRHEVIEMYDARLRGLDEAFAMVIGDICLGIAGIARRMLCVRFGLL